MSAETTITADDHRNDLRWRMAVALQEREQAMACARRAKTKNRPASVRWYVGEARNAARYAREIRNVLAEL